MKKLERDIYNYEKISRSIKEINEISESTLNVKNGPFHIYLDKKSKDSGWGHEILSYCPGKIKSYLRQAIGSKRRRMP